MTLKISKEISLPLEAVTQTFGILAIKGSGKSYTGSVMAEEMLNAGQQVIAIDPTGAWWGLQSSADGKKEGYGIVVFGGDHANIALDEHSGELIAQTLVEQKISAILDLSIMRKGAMKRFVADFLETLYRINREALHVFVDEADLFAPQKTFGDEARTLGAMEDMVRRGRKRGIGCTMITQRPASINKDVLTQVEILIGLRLNHPRDIDAIEEWVKVNATIAQAKTMIDSLPSLQTGHAWIWSPSWLNVFKKVTIRKRTTFDSGATPKPGQRTITPKKLARIDIEKLGFKINESISKKKEEDPATLKKKIIELERQLKSEKTLGNVDRSFVIDNSETINKLSKSIEQLESEKHMQSKIIGKYKVLFDSTKMKFDELSASLKPIDVKIAELKPYQLKALSELEGKTKITYKKINAPEQTQVSQQTQYSFSLGKCERGILTVLAHRKPNESSKNLIAIQSGYSSSSGGFNNSLSKLKQQGFISGSNGIYNITNSGEVALGEYDPLPTGEALHKYWIDKLPKCESRILARLIEIYPASSGKHTLASWLSYSETSGGFNNSLSRLRTLELINGSSIEMVASSNLF